MKKISIIIVDDEPLARLRIRSLLAAEPEASIVAECGDGISALVAVHKHRPDLLFLDVQMPKLNGFEVLRQIIGNIPATIFITGFDKYAIEAFELHAVDYLLKPFRDSRFRAAYLHAKETFAHRHVVEANTKILHLLDARQSGTPHLQSITVKTEDRVLFIPTEEIDHIEAARNYVVLHAGAETHVVRENLGHLEKLLNPREFARVSRFAMANIKRIRGVEPGAKGKLILLLKNGVKLDSSLSMKEIQALLQLR